MRLMPALDRRRIQSFREFRVARTLLSAEINSAVQPRNWIKAAKRRKNIAHGVSRG